MAIRAAVLVSLARGVKRAMFVDTIGLLASIQILPRPARTMADGDGTAAIS